MLYGWCQIDSLVDLDMSRILPSSRVPRVPYTIFCDVRLPVILTWSFSLLAGAHAKLSHPRWCRGYAVACSCRLPIVFRLDCLGGDILYSSPLAGIPHV